MPLATIGIPTICMILLFLLPFYDRGPERRPERRPIATTAGIFTIAAMGYLTYLGAHGRPADADRHADAGSASSRRARTLVAAVRDGQAGRRRSRAAWPATRSARTATTGPGPPLTDDRRAPARAGDRAHADQPDGADAVVQEPAEPREVQRARRRSSRSSSERACEPRPASGHPRRSRRSGRCSTASPASTTS